MTQFSPEAHALLSGSFMGQGNRITYGMRENVPSEKAAAALQELTDAGVLVRVVAPTGAVSYGLSQYGKDMDRSPPGDNFEEKMRFIKEHGRFSLSVPNPDLQSGHTPGM